MISTSKSGSVEHSTCKIPVKTTDKRLTVCADDYSLNPAVNAGILALLTQDRLSATSCMTQSPTWQTDAIPLLALREKADIGLHFNLTHPFPNAWLLPLLPLMLRSRLHVLPLSAIRDSLRFQLDAFENAIDSAPDFIDGHQHVHMFPQVRDIVISEYHRRYSGKLPYIRSLGHTPENHGIKSIALRVMGANALQQQLERHQIPCNTAFAGLYNLQPDDAWSDRMQRWLTALPTGGLLMCHPASALTTDDNIAATRVEEYRYLSSPSWPQLLADCQVKLGKLSTLQ